jgi:two-component system, cell cycle sensor histidine kinase and response regulator CckA
MLVFRARHPRTRIVLLVEELEPLRTVLQTILEKAGHLVLFAENSEKALRIAGTYVGSIDLLFTHMRLHGGSGPELASLLRPHQPEMAALYMSKSLIEMMELSDAKEFISSLLPHPFSPEILLRRVRMLLATHL